MSHEATNWAVQQRGISANAKILLWQLADRHNRDTRECFGLQKKIAEECEFSRSTFNRVCIELEEAGLIRRVQRQDPVRRTQLPTYYILAIDFDRELKIEGAVSQIDTRKSRVPKTKGTVCQNETKPCVTGDTAYKPVKQPVNNLAREVFLPLRGVNFARKRWEDVLEDAGLPRLERVFKNTTKNGIEGIMVPCELPPHQTTILTDLLHQIKTKMPKFELASKDG